jgi:hypothetical protein
VATAAPIVARITLRRLAIPAVELVLWVVTLGVIACIDAFLKLLVAVIKGTVGKVPFVGGFVTGKALKLKRAMIGYLAAAEAGVENRVAGAFQDLASVFVDLANEIADAARAFDTLAWKVAKTVPGPTLWRRLEENRKRTATAQRTADRALNLATENALALDHPTRGKAGVATTVATRPLAQRLTRLERSTDSRLDRLEHARASTVPVALPHTGGVAYPGRREISDLWKKVRQHDRLIAGGLGVGVLLRALTRLRLGWLRCSNVGRLGRRACALDPSQLDGLLFDTLLLVGTLSIVEYAHELQAVTELGERGVRAIIREA